MSRLSWDCGDFAGFVLWPWSLKLQNQLEAGVEMCLGWVQSWVDGSSNSQDLVPRER